MLKKILIFSLLYCSFLSSVLFGQSLQYENKIVDEIEIILEKGSSDASIEAIRARLKTREGGVFSQNEFDNDLKKLVQDFDRVEPSLQVSDDKVIIKLRIWPRAMIRSIIWSGNQKLDSKALKEELGIATGIVFDRVAFNRAFHKLKAYYIKKGFFEAELEYVVRSDPLSNDVDIEIIVKEGRSGRIKEICFHNFSSEEESDILEFMVTKEWSFFTSWFTEEGTYREEAIQQDEMMILNYLINRGFADAQVKIEICETASEDRILVSITAEKGELYRFGEITFEGNTIYDDAFIRSILTIAPGEPYSPEALHKTVENIASFYGCKGYIEANIDYEPCLIEGEHIYAIHLVISEEDQYYIGLIKVLGNNSTQTNVILHESLLVPGEVFNVERLKKTEERLKNIGFFKNVNVYAVKSQESCLLGPNYRDVHIEVEETSTGNFGALFGFSTSESVFGGLKVTEQNFNYKGLGCLFTKGYRALRGGGEYAHLSATIGAKSTSYVFSWTKPYFMDTPWTVGFDIERSSTRYISEDYDIKSLGGSLHATYQINAFVKLGWHYRLKNTTVHVTDSHSEQMEKEAHNHGVISASGFSLVYDSTDSPHLPTSGFRSRLEGEFAGIGGDHSFWSFAYLNSYYIPICKKGVLKYRGDARYLFPAFGTSFSSLPLDERFFLGGDNLIRGYRPYDPGPKFAGTHQPRGGISLYFLSAEYLHQFTKRIGFFVFMDAGYLSRFTLHVGVSRVAVGYGLRVKIFEGGPPLTIGMGYPLNPHDRSEVKKFFMSVGTRF